MKFNPRSEKLPFKNFCFGKRGYIRRIDDINPKQKNGYGLIGEFMPRDECEYEENKLYLSCSRGKDKEVYHLFTIQKDAPKLLKTSTAQKGAVRILWDDIASFIENQPKKSANVLADKILSETKDFDTLYKVAQIIVSEAHKDDTIQKIMNDKFQKGCRSWEIQKALYPSGKPWKEWEKEEWVQDYIEYGKLPKDASAYLKKMLL